MESILPQIWFLILCLEIGLYVVLDGADLGIGLLTLLPQESEGKRGLMMQTIGPIWDANETWLVIAGGTLFGAFPLVYSIVLNALYIPVMLILFGLIFRAVSFEFREHRSTNIFGSSCSAWAASWRSWGKGLQPEDFWAASPW